MADCESGYTSSTYKPTRCKSKQCSFAKVKFDAYGDYCLTEPKPGCNNNTCHTLVAELAENVLAIGTAPVVLVSQRRFIFTCVESYMMKHLAKGVTGIQSYMLCISCIFRYILIWPCNVSTTGIVGFGHNSTISIPNQIAWLDSKFSRKFGICLSSSTRSSGVIFVGSTPYNVYNDISKNLAYTPLVGNSMDFLTPMEHHVKCYVHSNRTKRGAT